MKFHVYDTKTGRSFGVFEAKGPEQALSEMARLSGFPQQIWQRTPAASPDVIACPCTKFVVERLGRYELVHSSSQGYAAQIAGNRRAVVWVRHEKLYRRSYEGQIGDEYYGEEDTPSAVVERLGK